MRRLIATLAGAALMLTTASAMATVVNMSGSEKNMQTILNEITLGGVSSVNAATDFIKDPNDSLWTTGGVGVSSATMIIELAGLKGTNNFGIYDSANISNKAQLFGGAASAGNKVTLTFGNYGANNLLVTNLTTPSFSYFNFDSSVFGFYFNNGSQTFYSDTTKNADGYDHMVAYGSPSTPNNVKLPSNPSYTPWLQNEFVLGFEDTVGGGDHDYNDMVLMVESVAPVPEPGTILLLGAGFLGLAIYGKRRKNA